MTLDLRLAIPACSCWLAAAVLIATPGAQTATAVALWLVALLITCAMVVDRRPRRRAAWGVLCVTCAGAALIASVVAVASPARFPPAIEKAVERHASVTATLTVWSMAARTHSVGGYGRGDGAGPVESATRQVRFQATLTELTEGPATTQMSVPVVVFTQTTPSSEEGMLIGSTIRLSGTLRGTAAGDSAAALLFGRSPPEPLAPPPWWLAWANGLRAGFSGAASALPGDGGDLLPGLSIGDTSAVNDDLDTAMKASSLSHLTAVSGANCAVLIVSVMLLCGYLGLGRMLRMGLSLVVLLGFVVLVTPEPSVLRAAVMASVVMVSLAAGRPGGGVPALCLAVMVMLVADPWLARNYGFALSVLATAGLLLLAGPLTRTLSRWMPGAVAAIIAIPLAAQLACQPVLVLLSPSLPLYGVPANMLAAPAAPAATIIGLGACLLLPFSPNVAAGLLHLAWLPATWIAAVAQTTSRLPGSRLPWPEGFLGFVSVTAFTLLILALVLRRDGPARARWPAGAAALLIAFTGGYAGSLIGSSLARVAGFPADWQIAACDIGQGDAVLVRGGDSGSGEGEPSGDPRAGAVALIDVGPDPALLTVCLHELGIERIDLLVLTHYDLDHVGGIDAVIGMVDVALVGVAENSQDDRLHERLTAGGAVVREAQRGDGGTLGALRWDILWPPLNDPPGRTGNAASVTVMFDGRGIRSLFLGDLDEDSQDAMLRASQPGPVDVVKVAHHGSANQSPALYASIAATVGLISVGADNGYGHPTQRLLDILASAGTTAVRTDEQGMTVIAPGDGGGLVAWTEKAKARGGARADPACAPAGVARMTRGGAGAFPVVCPG